MKAPYRHDPGEPLNEPWDDGPAPAEPAWPEVYVTDNPVVAILYGTNGQPLLQLHEREPIGFRLR